MSFSPCREVMYLYFGKHKYSTQKLSEKVLYFIRNDLNDKEREFIFKIIVVTDAYIVV